LRHSKPFASLTRKIVEEGKPLYGQGEARIAASLVEEAKRDLIAAQS